MLRLLITTGVLLMVVGFGTAGWQYWQNTAASAPGTSPVADGTDVWLGTPTGGIVPAEVTAGFLLQDRFVPGRIATILRTAALTDLLRDGESLPDPVFLEVMADIRAPLLAEGLCPVLTGSIAADCAVQSARVVPGSVDPARGTAQFRVELAYRLKPDGADLPDLSGQIFDSLNVEVAIAPDPAVAEAGTVEVALAAVVDTGQFACLSDSAGLLCRITGLTLEWAPGVPYSGTARIGWLSPLPEGVYPAPEIGPAPEG